MQGRWGQSVTYRNVNSYPLFLNAPVLNCHSLEERSLRQRHFSFLSYKKTFHGAGSLHCMCSTLAASLMFNPIWEWWEACELPNGILQSGKRTCPHDLRFWPCWEDISLDLSKALGPLLLVDQGIVKANFHYISPPISVPITFFPQKNRVVRWSKKTISSNIWETYQG